MDQGYIKLWRKSLESDCWKNPNVWRFWCWCLMKATWEKREVIVGRQKVTLEPGQFVFGRRIAAEETGLSEQEIRTVLATSKSTSNLTIKSTNKFSIISIINWDRYQGDKNENNQQINQQSNHQINHKQEVKKKKKKETPLTPLAEIPNWIDRETWVSFQRHRTSLGSKMTDEAQRLTLMKLERFMGNGFDPNEILKTSIENGWKGVFEPKNNGRQATKSQSPVMEIYDEISEQCRERFADGTH